MGLGKEPIIARIVYSADRQETSSKTVIFLHGLLVGDGVERSAFLCAPLLRKLVILGRLRIVMPEFDLLFKRRYDEPKDLRLGPVSRPVIDEIKRLTGPYKQFTVIAYSYGAVILAKLLRTPLAEKIEAIGLIAPAVSWIRDSWIDPLSMLQVSIISGTHDKFARDEDILRRWFPRGQFCSINGANHLYYLMPNPMDCHDEHPGIISRDEQLRRTVQNLIAYLGIPLREKTAESFGIVEVTQGGNRDLTEEFERKMKQMVNKTSGSKDTAW